MAELREKFAVTHGGAQLEVANGDVSVLTATGGSASLTAPTGVGGTTNLITVDGAGVAVAAASDSTSNVVLSSNGGSATLTALGGVAVVAAAGQQFSVQAPQVSMPGAFYGSVSLADTTDYVELYPVCSAASGALVVNVSCAGAGGSPDYTGTWIVSRALGNTGTQVNYGSPSYSDTTVPTVVSGINLQLTWGDGVSPSTPKKCLYLHWTSAPGGAATAVVGITGAVSSVYSPPI